MSFQTLPNEIIIQILGLLPDQMDLTRCSITSRCLHAVTEPVLYAKFVERHWKDIPLLLRAIEGKPQLAQHVRHVQLCEPNLAGILLTKPSSDVVRYGPWPNLENMLLGFFSHCGPVGEPGESDFEPISPHEQVSLLMSRMICDDSWDLLASVLPLIFQNLQSFHFHSHGDDVHNVLTSLKRIGDMQNSSSPFVRDSPHSLYYIGKLSITVESTEEAPQLHWEDMMLLLEIPSVTVFQCYRPLNNSAIEETNLALPMKQLTLQVVSVSYAEVDKLLKRCNKLEGLSIDYVNCDPSGSSPIHIFTQGLQRVKSTLLSLRFMDEAMWNADSNDPAYCTRTPLISLAGFSKLHTLEISSQVLLGMKVLEAPRTSLAASVSYQGHDEWENDDWETTFTLAHLPASLVHLILHNAPEDVLNVFSDFDLELLPNLRTIRIDFCYKALPVEENLEWQRVCNLYQEHGVVIEHAYQKLGDSVKNWSLRDSYWL